MKIDLFTVAWNEIDRIQQFLDYYKNEVDSITIYDNYSVDGTDDICLQNGCTVYKFGEGEHNESELMNIRNTCWQQSKADWVIICDVDEYLRSRNNISIKKQLSFTPCNIIQPKGVQMISRDIKPFREITTGYYESFLDKRICFKPNDVRAMNYAGGSHFCYPVMNTGEPVINYTDFYMLHYSMVNKEAWKNRYKQYKSRMSRWNIVNNAAIHYMFEDEILDIMFKTGIENMEEIWL